jgi:hypothetical protein
MKNYRITVPPTREQGSFSVRVGAANKREATAAALWSYNSARGHDGQPPLKRMPRGTVCAALTIKG